jgi:hypothetical protein
VKASVGHASTGLGNRLRVALDGYDLARWTHQSGNQHRHVSYSRPEIQNALPRPNSRFTKKSFGDGSDTRRLPNQTLMLGIGVA